MLIHSGVAAERGGTGDNRTVIDVQKHQPH